MESLLKPWTQKKSQSGGNDTSVAAKPSTKLDYSTLSATIATKSGPLDISLFGLPYNILSFLALHGAVALLRRRRNPEKTWQEITSGRILDKKAPKNTPVTVQAWAAVRDAPIEDVYTEWRALSRKEQSKIRRTPEVMKKSLELRYPELT
jgi:hypothetical protein